MRNRKPHFRPSDVRTLAAAMGTPAHAHDYAITDVASGRTKGIYATEALAIAALQRLIQPGTIYVLTVLHPDGCDCPDAPR